MVASGCGAGCTAMHDMATFMSELGRIRTARLAEATGASAGDDRAATVREYEAHPMAGGECRAGCELRAEAVERVHRFAVGIGAEAADESGEKTDADAETLGAATPTDETPAPTDETLDGAVERAEFLLGEAIAARRAARREHVVTAEHPSDVGGAGALRCWQHAAAARHHDAVDGMSRARRAELKAFVAMLVSRSGARSSTPTSTTYVVAIAADPEIGLDSFVVRVAAQSQCDCWTVLADNSDRFLAMVARVRTDSVRSWHDLSRRLHSTYPGALSVRLA